MVLTVEFELAGQPFTALNGGPNLTFDEAISFQVSCDSQDEVDRFWDALSEGGSAQRAMQAMFGMKKLDVAALEAAAAG
jgi:predicted 3-demethylubiquinone-9 3-methyltransferase (glyoxalase superfamily)